MLLSSVMPIIIALLHNSQRIVMSSIDDFFSIHSSRNQSWFHLICHPIAWFFRSCICEIHTHTAAPHHIFPCDFAPHLLMIFAHFPVKYLMMLLVLLSWHSLHMLSWVIAHVGFTHRFFEDHWQRLHHAFVTFTVWYIALIIDKFFFFFLL
jgi:hypothetical protein